MSDKNEQLEPTPFELAPPPEPAGNTSQTKAPNWVLPALGGLVLLALLVVFWLPAKVADTDAGAGDKAAPAGDAVADTPASAAAPSPTTPASSDASPWSDAQAAKLRKEAQDVLQALLDLQFALDERGAEQWAGDAWAAATAAAQAGDALYRQREYIAAKAEYASGLEQLQAIDAAIPETVDMQLERARAGLEEGLPEQVTAALELVELIEPENAQLPGLQQRASVLAPLMAQLDTAATAESNGDLAGAEGALREATRLDPQHQRAAAELQRVSALHLDQRFNDAMSDGYAALDKGAYSRAREQFRRAASLKAGSAEAGSALQEVDVAEQANRLSTIKRQGTELEGSEQWQAAVDAYEQALKLDTNVLFAREGLKRSQARARLDKQFSTAIDQPERLSDIAVAEATEKLLQQARTISPRGPVLTQQISTIERLLEQYNTLVPVRFRSDGETEVIVYKVARLGRFEETQLTLRPGTYQVRGSRRGYRDILQTFSVSHEGPGPPLTVSCTERIL
jgi:tetratricopeptide (TPR) repeat protein